MGLIVRGVLTLPTFLGCVLHEQLVNFKMDEGACPRKMLV